MITQVIDALSLAFARVINLVGGGLDGVFGAVEELSSGVF